jgi:hypothetical protein
VSDRIAAVGGDGTARTPAIGGRATTARVGDVAAAAL